MAESKTTKKNRRKGVRTFNTYIKAVLKTVHPDLGTTKKAKKVLNDIINDLFNRIKQECRVLLQQSNVATLTARTVQTAVRLQMPGELAKHAVSEGTKAVTKYTSSVGSGESIKTSKSERAGLTFPVGRINTMLRKNKVSSRVGAGAGVYLTAVLEYIIAEILEVSGNMTYDNKRSTITGNFISRSIHNDAEMSKFLGQMTVGSASVAPHIDQNILSKQQKKRLVSKAKKSEAKSGGADEDETDNGDEAKSAGGKKKKSTSKKGKGKSKTKAKAKAKAKGKGKKKMVPKKGGVEGKKSDESDQGDEDEDNQEDADEDTPTQDENDLKEGGGKKKKKSSTKPKSKKPKTKKPKRGGDGKDDTKNKTEDTEDAEDNEEPTEDASDPADKEGGGKKKKKKASPKKKATKRKATKRKTTKTKKSTK